MVPNTVEASNGAIKSHCELLRIAIGTDFKPGCAGRRLKDGEENRRLLVFGKRHIFAVFHEAHDLNAFPARQFEVTADSILRRAKDFARELAVHDGNARRLGVVMRSKNPARKQLCAGSLKIARRDVVNHGFGSSRRGAQVRRTVLEDRRSSPAESQWHTIREACAAHSRNVFDCIEQALLHLRNPIATVVRHIQIGAHQHRILRRETELRMDRACQSKHRHQR
jgi:hypothetical protein